MVNRTDKCAGINSVEELKKHLQFNHELLLKADNSYCLYQKFVELHQSDEENKFPHLLVALIDALVTNCVMIIVKLMNKKEGINIHKSIKCAITFFPEDKRLLSIQSLIENESTSIGRLRARRNKCYAHSVLENLNDDVASEYPLFLEDLNSTIEICFKAINTANLVVNGSAIGGYDEESNKRFILSTKLALIEMESLKDIFLMNAKMVDFMTKNAPYDLHAIIHSKLDGGE